ncbi:3'-5' exonuclease [Aureimonas jatrophae]|uniref:DNA polymerase-3 subunit epsilon n=1 Tax=Aureimonas jatrophae TaxID=1166073 RepID=A0A1H0M5Z3_9HYPH|nr:3'-5' exonuclease [Aureimonas jatrophae]MBB3952612.1 DNA polymerase-3 subunit epsilon [Aureimonas jatrophae]SDO75775.1 DNA polymerase-3 subunit epsilon [Aureimonas jatrophae]
MSQRSMAFPDLQADLFARDDSCSVAPTQRFTTSIRHLPDVPASTVPRQVLDEDDMLRHLEGTGRYRILRQLLPRPVRPLVDTRVDGVRIGVVLDTETTGLDHATNEVIELGMVAFTYDDTGIRDVVGVFSALREPARPIAAEITRITGITDELVRGRRIDTAEVARFIEPVDLVIAHNARFDRPFCEKLAPGFDVKPWACSVSEVDWTALGYEGTKLGYLVGQSGWFHNGHRAVDDCHALLEVLASVSRKEDVPAPFPQLLRSARQTRLRIHAIGSPFHTKDVLKARGYRWCDGTNGRPKCWWREIDEKAYDDEAFFLTSEIYGRDFEAHVERLTARERFKA